MVRGGNSILLATLASLGGCHVDDELTHTAEATGALATHTFEWEDETSRRFGMPAIRNRINFDADVRRCVTSP